VSARVLLVDDDPSYRLLLRITLRDHPLLQVVGEARDGREAAEQAAEHRPDLVLLDCSMPGDDAFDGLPSLRRACPGCRIILLSGHSPDDLRVAARSVGALGYISKDVAPSRLPDDLVALAGLVDAVEAVLHEASTRLESDLRSAGAARRFVSQQLESWDEGALQDTVTLLVSELVANAVVHAGSPVDVLVQLTDEVARVEVTDASDTVPVAEWPGAAADDDPDPDAETSGRGLAIVDAMAQRWGAQTRAGGGKTVWFEVARTGPTP
jgi:DNA-binding NarL/FixJ family response regulator